MEEPVRARPVGAQSCGVALSGVTPAAFTPAAAELPQPGQAAPQEGWVLQ